MAKKKKHTKRCSSSLAIRAVQIKSTVRYHVMGITMAVIKKKNKTKKITRVEINVEGYTAL